MIIKHFEETQFDSVVSQAVIEEMKHKIAALVRDVFEKELKDIIETTYKDVIQSFNIHVYDDHMNFSKIVDINVNIRG